MISAEKVAWYVYRIYVNPYYIFGRVGGEHPKMAWHFSWWWNMKCTTFKSFLIPDDGVSSIDSYHLGVLDNRFVTVFLACRRDVISMLGLGPSILFFSIENLAVLILLSLCQLYFLYLENLGSGNSSEFIYQFGSFGTLGKSKVLTPNRHTVMFPL